MISIDSICDTNQHTISADITVPGDKSISHRAVILSAISEGITTIENILLSDDVLCTIDIMRELGVKIEINGKSAVVHGVGLYGLQKPKNPLNCGNSGTTMRLLCGLLSAQQFDSVLIGDVSLMKRPMARIAEPLRLMGAKIQLSSNNTAPIKITGNQAVKAIDYELPIPSAQVKSGILLASLYAPEKTIVREKIPTRDHTEKMLSYIKNNHQNMIKVPGDISSAAFFIVLACITKNADITIREVGVNPFRTGIIEILKIMGANITIFNEQFFGLEPVADIRVRYAPLKGIIIPEELISKAIDELPIILIAAATANGKTILRNAAELRVKESDRISAMCAGFKNIGVMVHEYSDGMMIEGPQSFLGGEIDSFGDHRIAMAFAIAGNIAAQHIQIKNAEMISTSFPNFITLANTVGMKIRLY